MQKVKEIEAYWVTFNDMLEGYLNEQYNNGWEAISISVEGDSATIVFKKL